MNSAYHYGLRTINHVVLSLLVIVYITCVSEYTVLSLYCHRQTSQAMLAVPFNVITTPHHAFFGIYASLKGKMFLWMVLREECSSGWNLWNCSSGWNLCSYVEDYLCINSYSKRKLKFCGSKGGMGSGVSPVWVSKSLPQYSTDFPCMQPKRTISQLQNHFSVLWLHGIFSIADPSSFNYCVPWQLLQHRHQWCLTSFSCPAGTPSQSSALQLHRPTPQSLYQQHLLHHLQVVVESRNLMPTYMLLFPSTILATQVHVY